MNVEFDPVGRNETGDNSDVIRRQREALEELHAELDALPVEGEEDGFSGRDHDKVLYGGPAPGKKGGFPETRS